MSDQSFPAILRLKSKKLIRQLFTHGQSFAQYPYKIHYLSLPITEASFSDGRPYQVLFSVSKKKFPRAVDRNLLKRRMKEAFRLNKHHLTIQDTSKFPFILAFVYIGNSLDSYEFMEHKLKRVLLRLNETIQQKKV